MQWWIRPLVRLIAACLLPLVVPAVVTLILWLLPGDPAEILCPPGVCDDEARVLLAQHLHIDQGPVGFFTNWLSNAVHGDFGRSLRAFQGITVAELLWDALPSTVLLIVSSVLLVLLFSALAALGRLPRALDSLWQGIGLVPAVILSLVFAAIVQIRYGAGSTWDLFGLWDALLSFDTKAMGDRFPTVLRLIFGAITLGVADGTLGQAVVGTRSVFEEEFKQRYIQIALLRGESPLVNALPNVTPALIGQFRSRVLHLMSGAVIVEVVLGISGIGELLWDGTLLQDFLVVLAAAWAFALVSGVLLFIQATAETAVELHVRRAPSVPQEPLPPKGQGTSNAAGVLA